MTTITATGPTRDWTLKPDRALPADPVTRPLAREIYASVRDLPIVSMHGHVPVEWFADDTRAFCSIPARHDLARRIDAGYLARLVAEHRLDLDEALEVAADLAYRNAVESYRAR